VEPEDDLICPVCNNKLVYNKESITCLSCESEFRIENNIPNFMIQEAKLSDKAINILKEDGYYKN
jgi:uncharacterized protein YbaR (Trm112 family)